MFTYPLYPVLGCVSISPRVVAHVVVIDPVSMATHACGDDDSAEY
jgi:hypothetical protein